MFYGFGYIGIFSYGWHRVVLGVKSCQNAAKRANFHQKSPSPFRDLGRLGFSPKKITEKTRMLAMDISMFYGLFPRWPMFYGFYPTYIGWANYGPV